MVSFSGSKEVIPGRRRPPNLQALMPFHVHNILLVSSLYDSFILQEDGQLSELIIDEFLDLNLRTTPNLTHVSSGAEALELASHQRRFNLIITTPHLGDMTAAELALKVREAGLQVPVVLLAYNNRELGEFLARNDVSAIDRLFLWQGDVRILLAIVKYIEDRANVAHDTQEAGVQVILVVEDNVGFYSSFLPIVFTEVMQHHQRLISEGVNLSHKLLRMRARPKILLCNHWEEAWEYFSRYQAYILGIISDVDFPRGGVLEQKTGIELARQVRRAWPDIPVLLQSSHVEYEPQVREAGADFLIKGSPTFLADLRRFMIEHFSFGDFIFRLPDGREVDRASDLHALEQKLKTVPAESLAYHGARNHFSNWLKARTEFALAYELRPRRNEEFDSLEDLRRTLIQAVEDYRRTQRRGVVEDFRPRTFDPAGSFARIGGGSLGGKARGLAFVRHLFDTFDVSGRFEGVHINVPPAVVLGTEVFDLFLENNRLQDFALRCQDDGELDRRFLSAGFPEEPLADLGVFLDMVRHPLAIRSSSLLEDSQYLPFTGVYETFMVPNAHPDPLVRMRQLVAAIKKVYASAFSSHAKAYLQATPYRLEEEKMAVIIQRVVGARHSDRFYPDFAGVARSHNFYPTAPLTAADGIAAVGLGLGRTVVQGDKCLSFCPRYPQHMIQFSSVKDMLGNSQRDFWALHLSQDMPPVDAPEFAREVKYGLEVAEADGTLAHVGSTYSHENLVVYDGLSRPGVRLVSFAPILKHKLFPLAAVLETLLEIGSHGMGTPIEIEFAVNLHVPPGTPREFGFLQMRPLSLSREHQAVDVGSPAEEGLICRSSRVLGNGRVDSIFDAVVVDIGSFNRSRSRETAAEVAQFNASLVKEHRPYLLVGVGRWGSHDPWLGIPVTWDQISGARVIVEAGFKDFRVTPSQGSHFFQNITSFQVGYFSVNPEAGEGSVDWEWLGTQPALADTGVVRHLRFPEPLVVKMDGRRQQGVVFKPGRVNEP